MHIETDTKISVILAQFLLFYLHVFVLTWKGNPSTGFKSDSFRSATNECRECPHNHYEVFTNLFAHFIKSLVDKGSLNSASGIITIS